ncbi:MAG: serine/threonine-protein kinase [Planctomycetota bacterium]
MSCEKTGCPTAEELKALCRGDLSPDRERLLTAQLEECSACARALEELGGSYEKLSSKEWNEITRECQSPGLQEVVVQSKRASLAGERNALMSHDDLAPWLESCETQLGRVGQYQLIECIGRGGMGIVFRALDEELSREVALKFMSPGMLIDPIHAVRFQREARAVAAISHESVIAIHAVSRVRELPYLVMELVDGESLQSRLDRGENFEIDTIIEIAWQIASGLAAAHAKGIVHRDIKPANLLIDKNRNRIRITDFGLAISDSDLSVTTTGMLLGTPEFLAPEQLAGKPVDQRADLFSLGCVLFRLAAGRPAFGGETIWMVIKSVHTHNPPSLSSLYSDVPEWFSVLVARLLEKDPDRRPATADEVEDILKEQSAAKTPIRETREKSSTKYELSSRNQSFKWFVFVAGAVVLLALGTVFSESVWTSNLSRNIALDSETLSRMIEGDQDTLVVELGSPGPFFVDPIELRDRSLKLTTASEIETAVLFVDCDSSQSAFTCQRGHLELDGVEIRVGSRGSRRIVEPGRGESAIAPVINADEAEVRLIGCRINILERPVLYAADSAVTVSECLIETGEQAITIAAESEQPLGIENSRLVSESGIWIESGSTVDISLVDSEMRGIFAIVAQATPNNEGVTIRSSGTAFECESAVISLVDYLGSGDVELRELPDELFPRWETSDRLDVDQFVHLRDQRNQLIRAGRWDEYVARLNGS